MVTLSVVIPCLNEEKTVGFCVEEAFRAVQALGLEGEVIVVDNGSTDCSGTIAREKGARVVSEPKQGYGYAYRRGFQEAKGEILIMADADGTYNFSDLKKMVHPLNNGADLVIGSRLKGRMFPGAMPWFRLYLGNHIATGLLNLLLEKNISDCMSGFRSFRSSAFRDISFRSKGMEFPIEMIVVALRKGLQISEVPITYHPRRGNHSKFKLFHDSFAVLRYLFLSCLFSKGTISHA